MSVLLFTPTYPFVKYVISYPPESTITFDDHLCQNSSLNSSSLCLEESITLYLFYSLSRSVVRRVTVPGIILYVHSFVYKVRKSGQWIVWNHVPLLWASLVVIFIDVFGTSSKLQRFYLRDKKTHTPHPLRNKNYVAK